MDKYGLNSISIFDAALKVLKRKWE
jgi:hypothetical protein